MIKELMDVQVSLLQADLAEKEIDTVIVAERAETLFLYAKCLRDFPLLPELLRSHFPEPPECFEAFISSDRLE